MPQLKQFDGEPITDDDRELAASAVAALPGASGKQSGAQCLVGYSFSLTAAIPPCFAPSVAGDARPSTAPYHGGVSSPNAKRPLVRRAEGAECHSSAVPSSNISDSPPSLPPSLFRPIPCHSCLGRSLACAARNFRRSTGNGSAAQPRRRGGCRCWRWSR